MKHVNTTKTLITISLSCSLLAAAPSVYSAGQGWSLVPYVGFSEMGDQSGAFSGAEDITDGGFDVSLDSGFVGGLSVRYNYTDSPWSSEFGWEYRSNDSTITLADNTRLPDGNYASNTFYLNGRYALTTGKRFTPWIGGGVSVIQEIDLDSEGSGPERSFSKGGAFGVQLMAGVDVDITERLYLTSELRYTGFTGLEMTEEGGDGKISEIDYTPITLGIGLGFRF